MLDTDLEDGPIQDVIAASVKANEKASFVVRQSGPQHTWHIRIHMNPEHADDQSLALTFVVTYFDLPKEMAAQFKRRPKWTTCFELNEVGVRYVV